MMQAYEFEMLERLTIAVERLADLGDSFYHDYGKPETEPERILGVYVPRCGNCNRPFSTCQCNRGEE
jgi:hypothetical protein